MEKEIFSDLKSEDLLSKLDSLLRESPSPPDWVKTMIETNTTNMNQQWEIIQLYMVFVFRKGKENNSKEKYTPYLAKSGIKFNNYKPELMEGTFD